MLKLHFAPNARAGRIVWLFEELGLPYELIRAGTQPRTVENRTSHPFGRVPILDDGDVSIFEAGAIIDYVLECHENGGLKPSRIDPRFPYYLQWFHYSESVIMPPINTVVVHTYLLPENNRDPMILRQAQQLLTRALEPIDEALHDQEYLIGDFSGADIMLGHACFLAKEIGSVGHGLKNFSAYVKRISKRRAFQKAFSMS